MKTVVLTYKGRDSWDRPVYEAAGRLYVDVNPRKSYKPNTKRGVGYPAPLPIWR